MEGMLAPISTIKGAFFTPRLRMAGLFRAKPLCSDCCTQPRLQLLAQPPADFEPQVLFFQAVRTNGSGIVASVAGIDHDSPNLQSQRANERALAARRRLCLSHLEFRRQIALFASRRPTGRGIDRAVRADSRDGRRDPPLCLR